MTAVLISVRGTAVRPWQVATATASLLPLHLNPNPKRRRRIRDINRTSLRRNSKKTGVGCRSILGGFFFFSMSTQKGNDELFFASYRWCFTVFFGDLSYFHQAWRLQNEGLRHFSMMSILLSSFFHKEVWILLFSNYEGLCLGSQVRFRFLTLSARRPKSTPRARALAR
jgi:hypothetical protein